MDIDKRGLPNPLNPATPAAPRPVFDIAKPAANRNGLANPPDTNNEALPSSIPSGTIITPSSTLTSAPPTAPVEAKPAAKRKGSKKKLLLALCAVLVIAAGSAGAYFYLTQKEDKPAPAAQETTPETTEEISSTDVDATTAEIDTALEGLNDSQDFDENGLSDESLGL